MRVKKFINFSTVWENYNWEKNNFFNLYSFFKKSFRNIIEFYKKNSKNTKFYDLMISDTFGDKDKRNKIINVLKKNFKRNKTTKIISKKLYMNLINVEDINNAIDILLKKNIKSDNFVLKNKRNLLINDIIIKINKISKKKIKIKWLSKNND